MIQGFWGLEMEPGKKYTQEIEIPFCLTMAALPDKLADQKRSSVKVSVNGNQYTLCSLIPNKIEQQRLNVTFVTGEKVEFSVTGKNWVHMTGNYTFEESNPDDDDLDYDQDESSEDELVSDEDEDEDESDDMDTSEEDDEEEEEEDSSDQEGDLEDVKAELPSSKSKKRLAESLETATSAKKLKAEASAAAKSSEKAKRVKFADIEANKAEKEKKALEKLNEEKKREPKKKVEEEKETKAQAKQKQQESKKKQEDVKQQDKSVTRLPNGLVIEDIKIGKGEPAKAGKRIGMRYVGKLTNNKVFDSNTSGKPFTFNLGRGEVIKGWDIGVAGMKIGGERKLTVPPHLAYGKRGAPPDIPGNATLVFEVKLAHMK